MGSVWIPSSIDPQLHPQDLLGYTILPANKWGIENFSQPGEGIQGDGATIFVGLTQGERSIQGGLHASWPCW